jgi:hypothetical protein
MLDMLPALQKPINSPTCTRPFAAEANSRPVAAPASRSRALASILITFWYQPKVDL